MTAPERDSGLFAAIVAVAAGLELNSTLRRIVTSATQLVDAQYGALGVLGANGTVEDFIHVGFSEDVAASIPHVPQGLGILGLLIDHPVPIRLDDLASHPASIGFPENHPPMKSFLGVPIRVRGEVFGNLYLTQKQNNQPFTADDERVVSALAAAAGVAIENARLFESSKQAQERARQLSVLEERDRIARDLHDLVIQRLFAVGMGLQAATKLVSDEATRNRIENSITDLDITVKEIRRTIFDLHQAGDQESIRIAISAEVERFTSQLTFRPHLEFSGPVDTLIPHSLHEHVIAVVREGLSNILRHANANSATVSVHASAKFLTIRIQDDGQGISDTDRRSGLHNLSSRASGHGGNLTLESGQAGGTTLEWVVPLS